ncbi:MAG: hypothetical protein JWO91_3017 [Acidobacteriaceae bacterium]|nr:hypothetical protein [Acidobacteriaceae bacterium]
MLLFPVVSATDDLHAMRPEVEESNPSKHIARQSDNNSPTAFSAVGGFPALLTTNSLFNAEYRAIGVISGRFHIIHIDIRIGLDSSRAPPSA